LKIIDGAAYAAIENIQFANELAELSAQTPIALMVDRSGTVHSLKIPLTTRLPADDQGNVSQSPLEDVPLLLFVRPPNGATRLSASRVKEKAQIKIVTKAAPFDGNFFNVMDRQEIPDAISEQLTRIFSGLVNFSRGLTQEASFILKYEAAYLDGNPVATGRVLYSAIKTDKDTFQAYWWQAPSRTSGHYYSPNGESLSVMSWKTPILYSRKTSNFGMRINPFTGRWANHQGIDIGAPLGTEVRATQEGKVKRMGWEGPYGNTIVIEHRNGFETLYAHLSGFAKIHVNQTISQGALIGFVGSTGMSTAPHLHYELRRHGTAIDPEQGFHSDAPAERLDGEALVQFMQYQHGLLIDNLASR
jgi:murein DD-endopeptidase MepM/ murein hydrolase activator NlpD